MKKIILSLAVLAVTLTGAVAQSTVSKPASTATRSAKGTATRETPETKAKANVEKLNAEVGLKADQVTSATKIFTDFYTKLNALRQQKATLDEKALEAKKKELKHERNNSLKAILTTEQWAKFQAANKENREANKAKQEQKKATNTTK